MLEANKVSTASPRDRLPPIYWLWFTNAINGGTNDKWNMLTVDQRRWPRNGCVANNDTIDCAISDDFCHFPYLAVLKVRRNFQYQTWPTGRYWRRLEFVTSFCYIRKQTFQQFPILKPPVVFSPHE